MFTTMHVTYDVEAELRVLKQIANMCCAQNFTYYAFKKSSLLWSNHTFKIKTVQELTVYELMIKSH